MKYVKESTLKEKQWKEMYYIQMFMKQMVNLKLQGEKINKLTLIHQRVDRDRCYSSAHKKEARELLNYWEDVVQNRVIVEKHANFYTWSTKMHDKQEFNAKRKYIFENLEKYLKYFAFHNTKEKATLLKRLIKNEEKLSEIDTPANLRAAKKEAIRERAGRNFSQFRKAKTMNV